MYTTFLQECYKSFVIQAMKKTNDELQFYKAKEKLDDDAGEIKQKCNDLSIFQHLPMQVGVNRKDKKRTWTLQFLQSAENENTEKNKIGVKINGQEELENESKANILKVFLHLPKYEYATPSNMHRAPIGSQ